jgi:tetratricopeptide (TPR) repeat protein
MPWPRRSEVRVTDNPAALFREAQRFQRLDQVPEAIAAYQRALLDWPEHANSWFNLGLLFRQAHRPEEALACYQRALNLGIASPEEVHLNRGVIYADYLRQDAEAERELRAALSLQPDFVPALLNLANIQEDRGRRDVALELYRRVLELDPHCTLALARFANMQAPADCDARLIGQLRAALERASLSDPGRALLGFALGRALDGSGAYGEAFSAYAAANAAVRAAAMRAGERYDRRAQEQFVDRLIRISSAAPAQAPPLPGPGPTPIFVCGMFRSGSTLAEQLLAQHPGVVAGGELAVLPSLIAEQLAPFPESLASKTRAELEPLARRYREAVAALFPGASYVTDKRPDNFLYIGLIKSLFPDAKIVHTTRDPLDNCLAIYFLHLDLGLSYATDLMDIGHYYREYRRLMAHWRKLYGADIIELNYDHFVHEPSTVAQPVFEALGWRWDPKYLEHPRSDSSVKTASVWQVRKPLYQSSSGRSRHYEQPLAPLRHFLAGLPPI